ncbi:MAG: pyridoxal phosphate-dependent aminotransferase [Chloroflexi bacterium]|nr:pyridoxal phosphate-dependent aminotransferase [Chloroflexota bacterium]
MIERRNRHFDELVSRRELRWLGQNTNHFQPHPAVREAMLKCIDSGEFHLYAPPLGLEALRRGILADLGVGAGFSVLVTDGAIEGLYHACRTLIGSGDQMLFTDPGWLWPRRFAASAGATVSEIPIYDRSAGFRLCPDRLRAAITPRTRLVYLVDPSNPLGSVQSEDELREIAEVCRAARSILIHDCTYRHFAARHSLAAEHYPEGTITTYSFSKWLGIAGLRLGALVASPEMIARLAEAPPNNLGASVLAQRAALAGLQHKAEWFPAVHKAQLANQASIKNAVDAIPGLALTVYPSNGNFVCIDVSGASIAPDRLCEYYLERNVLIRQARYHTDRFAERFVKVGTTVPSEWIAEFCNHLDEAVARCRGKVAASELF